MNWTFKGVTLPKITPSDEMFGFIYQINYTDGSKYIGKKQIWSITKKNFGKKQLAAITDKRVKTYEMIAKESNWRDYVGSTKEAKDLVVESKEMLEVCSDKINLTYAECKWMFKLDVLTDDTYINSNILGKFYSGKIMKGIE